MDLEQKMLVSGSSPSICWTCAHKFRSIGAPPEPTVKVLWGGTVADERGDERDAMLVEQDAEEGEQVRVG